ncbi:Uncharacterized protein FKW44_014246 [Caligus rogercresseyi]|uniref:Uncharacterized protein n=1 Tax=Caligus rogercresseyi TaxID=217165 RepID=A0A7T8GYL8_CALRO|nr:Uncharacterized protein FKW44_014246 [Caligus rogercresseyi]
MSVSPVFDPRKIRLAKEHFKHFHPTSLGRSFSCSDSGSSSLSCCLPSRSLSSDPGFDLKSWQVARGVYEDTLYLCPWCLLDENPHEEKSSDLNSLSDGGNIWSSKLFVKSDHSYFLCVGGQKPLSLGSSSSEQEDITRLPWDPRDNCGFNSLRTLATKGPDAQKLEEFDEKEISAISIDPEEEARILAPLRRSMENPYQENESEEEEEEDEDEFFDAVDDSPESGWESLEGSSRDEEDDEDGVFPQIRINPRLEGEESSSDDEEEEAQSMDNSENSYEADQESSFNAEGFMSESERLHRDWLRAQDEIKDLKRRKYIGERLQKILSVAFDAKGPSLSKSRAEAFESIPNMNRDENGSFEILDTNELQDLCYLSFVLRKEKFVP